MSDFILLDASIKMAFRLHDSYLKVRFQKREVESKMIASELTEKDIVVSLNPQKTVC
ncbi:hypothetical protein [Leptospira stimsonii]|uniref:hypothetical protein n=1 Tax=Leptospira stimsonii TaxID=2202203 RepID=UPI00143828AE|nr:hypothetical protein [Leptospira stimsonii]